VAKRGAERAETTYTVPTVERESKAQDQSEDPVGPAVNVEAATGSQHRTTSVI